MKVTQMLPVHEANLVANSGNAAFGVNVIGMWNSAHVLSSGIYTQLPLFVWETKRPQADNSRSLIDRQVSCFLFNHSACIWLNLI